VCVLERERARERERERCAVQETSLDQQSDGFGSSLTAVKDETWFHMC
jgi:hypothetical protein